MAYTEKQAADLTHEATKVVRDLNTVMCQTALHGQKSINEQVREHLLHGVGRRISVIKKSVGNVFSLFPPSAKKPLTRNLLTDIEINLHAFVINLSGIFDNWAWAYVLRHNLEGKIGSRKKVGMFLDATKRYLPSDLRDYLSSEPISQWHEKYLTSYRDALAHRIPLYVPPAQFTQEEGEQYNRLENEKFECIRTGNWDRHDEIPAEQATIGIPSFMFLHAFKESTPPAPIYLHPQMISDSRAIVEFGNLFLKHWHKSK